MAVAALMYCAWGVAFRCSGVWAACCIFYCCGGRVCLRTNLCPITCCALFVSPTDLYIQTLVRPKSPWGQLLVCLCRVFGVLACPTIIQPSPEHHGASHILHAVPRCVMMLCAHAGFNPQTPTRTPFVVLRVLDIPSAILTATSTVSSALHVCIAMMPPYQREGGVC